MTRPLQNALAAGLALSIGLAPIDAALAGEPEGQALRIVAEPPVVAEPPPITLAEPPAPVIEPAPVPAIPSIDSPRPRPGTGLVALGALSLAGSATLVIAGLAGPGWLDVSRRDAAIMGGLSLPAALMGSTLVITGAQVNRRYKQWADRNAVTPPRIGNGLIVTGAAVTSVGVAGLGLSVQRAIVDNNPTLGDWALVGVSGAVSTIGMAILINGMLTRSKFAAWESAAYLQPGTMALRGGAGLSLSGRF